LDYKYNQISEWLENIPIKASVKTREKCQKRIDDQQNGKLEMTTAKKLSIFGGDSRVTISIDEHQEPREGDDYERVLLNSDNILSPNFKKPGSVIGHFS
jgi:hypothetical protein